MKNHTDMLIFHTAICAGASQIATDGRRELDVLVATPSLRSGMEINMCKLKTWTRIILISILILSLIVGCGSSVSTSLIDINDVESTEVWINNKCHKIDKNQIAKIVDVINKHDFKETSQKKTPKEDSILLFLYKKDKTIIDINLSDQLVINGKTYECNDIDTVQKTVITICDNNSSKQTNDFDVFDEIEKKARKTGTESSEDKDFITESTEYEFSSKKERDDFMKKVKEEESKKTQDPNIIIQDEDD